MKRVTRRQFLAGATGGALSLAGCLNRGRPQWPTLESVVVGHKAFGVRDLELIVEFNEDIVYWETHKIDPERAIQVDGSRAGLFVIPGDPWADYSGEWQVTARVLGHDEVDEQGTSEGEGCQQVLIEYREDAEEEDKQANAYFSLSRMECGELGV